MKAKMLKIAGVKSEAAFYKKFPTQKAFMKVHGKEFKKAQTDGAIDKAQSGFAQGFGMNPQSQYQNTFAPSNNFAPANYNVPSPNINPMSGFQNADPFAMQNYGQQFMQNNPLPQQGTGQISNAVFGENKSATGGLGVKDYKDSSGFSTNMIPGMIGQASNIFNAFELQNKQKKSLEKENKLLGLFETLSQSTDINDPYKKNILDRPENYAQSTNMFYPSQGTGYDILRGVGRDGTTIRKAQDGINNFGPEYDIYSDAGYEPLDNSNKIKQYVGGGLMGNAISGQASNLIGAGYNNSAGFQAGNALGQYSDLIVPGSSAIVAPILGAIGGGLDQAFGSAGDINRLTQKNADTQGRIMGNSIGKNIGFTANRQEGGYMNPEYNPQVITMFGDHTSEDFADYAHKYRAGGHLKEYTPASERAMETYADGGELKTHWGGEVEPVSYNPYSEGEGFTYNAYGNSHFQKDEQGRTGIGLSMLKDGGDMGDEPDVEIETNEPISMTGDGAVVYGNLNTNKDLLEQFQLPEKYANRKVKHIVNNIIVPKERKYTDELEKIVTDNSFDNSKFGPLEDKTKEVKRLGLNMKLKKLAQDKENLAAYQDHIHKSTDFLTNLLGKEVSQEKFARNGEVSHILAKGEISQDTAQAGKKLTFKSNKEAIAAGFTKTPKGWVKTKKGISKSPTQKRSAEALGYIPKGQRADTASGLYGGVTPEQFKAYKEKNKWYDWNDFDPKDPEDVRKYGEAFNAKAKEVGSQASITPDKYFGQQYYSANLNENEEVTPAVDAQEQADVVTEDYAPIEETKKGFPWLGAASSLIRGFQPAFNMPIGSQINPELYALANNRVKGFAVNKTYDMLQTPAKYSADKDRNAVLSQAREAVKNAGNNPAAQSAIMASVADAMNQIGSKEFEVNQQGYQGVYNNNINTVNQNRNRNAALDMDAQLKMLQAESNTDARTLAAMTSAESKIAANKKMNFDLNMQQSGEYPDYTLNSSGQLIKLPRYVQFDTTGKGVASSTKDKGLASNKEFTYDAEGNIIGVRSKGKEDGAARDGKTIKKKNINGNIVKAFKNL